MIPDTIHFIYPATTRTRPWSLVNHAAVRLARKHHPHHRIIIWTNEPKGSFQMRITAALSGAEITAIDLSTQIGGVEIGWPQYISDVLRLQILIKHGGIYMDTDILLRQPLDAHIEFVRASNTAIMSWETPMKTSVCNALMISPPGNAFMAEWLRRMPEALRSQTWAQGGVVLPAQIAADPDLRLSHLMLDHTFACPLDLSRPWLFDPSLRDEAVALSAQSHAIHVFESFWRTIVKDIDHDWIERTPCLFSDIYRDAAEGNHATEEND
jgi:hypothetical protein